MWHVITLPNGRRLAINLFEVCMLDELHDDDTHTPVVVISFRNGSQLSVTDLDRELLDAILTTERGFNE